jgi:2-oxo-4-hydroxy-4-carboxy-5-ureidoimidazoline decarboxylase
VKRACHPPLHLCPNVSRVLLREFNDLSADEAAEVVRPWAGVPRWVETVVAGRPYGSVDELAAAARAAADEWSTAEVDAALARHPRIGERPTGEGTEATMSRAEQGAIRGQDDDVAAALARGNVAYEERFGRVFLIRAAGRSAAEILDQLTSRLENDPEAETAVVAGQLREIALLRLEGTFS